MTKDAKAVFVVVSEGGVIQGIFSNLAEEQLEIIVIDHDADESDDPAEREHYRNCLERAEPFLIDEYARW